MALKQLVTKITACGKAISLVPLLANGIALSTVGFGVWFGLFGGEFDWPCAQSECSYMHHAEILTAYSEKWMKLASGQLLFYTLLPWLSLLFTFGGWMVNLKAVLRLSLGPVLTKARVRRVVSMSVSPGHFCAATLSLNFVSYASHGTSLNWRLASMI